MDPLSDLLRVVRLDGAFFYPVEAAGTWNIEIAAADELTPRILPGAEHLDFVSHPDRGAVLRGAGR